MLEKALDWLATDEPARKDTNDKEGECPNNNLEIRGTVIVQTESSITCAIRSLQHIYAMFELAYLDTVFCLCDPFAVCNSSAILSINCTLPLYS